MATLYVRDVPPDLYEEIKRWAEGAGRSVNAEMLALLEREAERRRQHSEWWQSVLDLHAVYVPETYLLPQLAGGLLFGAGFVAAGLCPGTSCVAAASGRGDGAMVVLGMFAGVLVTGLAFAPLRELYESTARGPLT